MSFLCRVAGLSLRDRVGSLDIQEELGVQPLLLHTWGGVLGHVYLGSDPRADLGHTEEITSLGWLGNAMESSQRRWWR